MVTFFYPHLAYIEIDSMIFFPTLIISLLFVKRRYKALAFSILVSSIPFILWDIFATSIDSWSFNPYWIIGLKIINLPIEEILFFFVTPFACLMIYDFVNIKIRDNKIPFVRRDKVLIVSIIVLVLDFFFRYFSYTFVDLIYFSASLILVEIFDEEMFKSTNYWVFVALTYIPFLVFDYFLTSLPIVIYGPHSILGIRILTIPIEDAIYSLTMMNFYTLFYRVGERMWNLT
ncbi:lycopene cyclase [Sulfolobus sp. A20]|uniref:lycopene cyclase domain-containing protein n=1 Tax=Sulfolobaceae TaxID=118883 RepID=UPI000845C957|nr:MULTISPECIES: lycopene cyclase domain-containing protein [unclassified Sulfolobus]TRM75839.1 lycopene cyclase domain-containing protein [Sulfolobus sp. A20-N-F8]TRM79013.1 lycopene cyclase domain-containing protein [Sulfolobus sp. B5]TRM81457.1 lycopene cyclase domain-containing protein [Sulfolobus sp. D5]TRM82835.1 lycopene cyclase domain-containing protein [Sulfolobus sp. A20-N-F6]TRM83072.1 lycopene cyclase domain-containing protein [Sulfolobus sp. F3]TRM95288.1 lycopene cyclase domain-